MTKTTEAAELQQLERFLGTWTVRGRQLAGPVGPAADIAGTESYEWLQGGQFLVHRFDARLGDDAAACIEITGYDPPSGAYPTHTYYNDGRSNDWQGRFDERGRWILTGEWPMPDGRATVRCTMEFTDGGATRTARWESSKDGARWEPFWEVRATRAAA